jgi:glyoxylase-like metal-dependent hydrolase (beta-lactamase superfamily II)
MASIKLHVGDIEVVELVDVVAPFAFPLAQAFPTVSSDEWQRWARRYPGSVRDEATWVRAVRCYLIRAEHQTILVDTGIGPATTLWAQRAQTQGRLLDLLRAEGVTPDRVNTVLTTHLHADHIGWNGWPEEGQFRATFPNARYVMHAAEWEAGQAMLEANPAGVAALRDHVTPLREQGRLFLLPGDSRLAEGVQAMHTPGHTPGHMSVWVQAGGDALLLLGDVAVHPLQLADLSHVFSLDSDAAVARQTRARLLEKCAEIHAVVAACHFPEPGFGHVAIRDGGADWLAVS